jgi:hypothetical protein
LHFCDYLPFEENYGPQFEKKRSSFTQGWCVLSWLKLADLFWRKFFLKIFSIFFF